MSKANSIVSSILVLCVTLQFSIAHAYDISLEELIRRDLQIRQAIHRIESRNETNVVISEILIPAQMIRGVDSDVSVQHIRYDSEVFFEFDSAEITDAGRRVIKSALDELFSVAIDTSMVVVGHTDSTGRDDYNLDLSRRRAERVLHFIISQDAKFRDILLIGMGEVQPISSNRFAKGQSRNRRVEFFISPVKDASIEAAKTIEFDPCFRNDHDGLKIRNCIEEQQEVAVYDQDFQLEKKVQIDSRNTIEATVVKPRDKIPAGNRRRDRIQ